MISFHSSAHLFSSTTIPSLGIQFTHFCPFPSISIPSYTFHLYSSVLLLFFHLDIPHLFLSRFRPPSLCMFCSVLWWINIFPRRLVYFTTEKLATQHRVWRKIVRCTNKQTHDKITAIAEEGDDGTGRLGQLYHIRQLLRSETKAGCVSKAP